MRNYINLLETSSYQGQHLETQWRHRRTTTSIFCYGSSSLILPFFSLLLKFPADHPIELRNKDEQPLVTSQQLFVNWNDLMKVILSEQSSHQSKVVTHLFRLLWMRKSFDLAGDHLLQVILMSRPVRYQFVFQIELATINKFESWITNEN